MLKKFIAKLKDENFDTITDEHLIERMNFSKEDIENAVKDGIITQNTHPELKGFYKIN